LNANPSAAAAPTLSERMADYIHRESLENIDAAARARAKYLLIYHIGLAFRSLQLKDPHLAESLAAARELSEGGGSATVIGQPLRLTLADAAMVNCTMMRSQGYDDVMFPAGIHPGLVTLPVALAIAEREHRSGAELVTGIVTAYEILGKFGRWTWSIESPRRGTMPFGSFGSITAAAKLLRLSPKQITSALGYAAHTAMGVAEGDFGVISHYYSLVCRNGIIGAYLARADAWSSATVLEGKWGFLESFFGSAQMDADELIGSLGHNYAVMTSVEKRYPGTALNQVAIDVAGTLVTEHGLKPADVAEIQIELAIERRNFAAGHRPPPYPLPQAASSSVLFHIAMLLLDGGRTDPKRIEELTNPDLLALIDKMRIEWVLGRPVRYARVQIRTHSGRELMREGSEFDYPPEPCKDIIERHAKGILPPQKIARVIELLDHLEQVPDVSELTQTLVP
jgi:2-methylcitrate dehydratase PrpD